MIVHLKYNNAKVEEVTFDDASPEIIEKVKIKGQHSMNKESGEGFEFFYDTDNTDVDKWNIPNEEYIKEFVTMLVYLTKPYLREHKLKNLINDKDN